MVCRPWAAQLRVALPNPPPPGTHTQKKKKGRRGDSILGKVLGGST